ncbi:MAG: phosphoglycerate kinase [Candidatus Kerfeldbacteria bacterium]|nr:phosphoglycerate kinase [Candidatus Kerfeldbacteria bacterium]
MRSYTELQLAHRTVCIRVDYNVPLRIDRTIVDDARIRASLETIQYALSQQARVVLCSHMGRPHGIDPRYSLHPVALALSTLLQREVKFSMEAVGDVAQAMKKNLADGEVLLLENLRFYEGEEANDPQFAQQLAEGIDVYIDDAFGAIHRAHASIDALPRLVKERAVGALIEREITALDRITHASALMLIIGGAKMGDKIEMLKQLLPKTSGILVGGALANCFLKARDISVGASRVDDASVSIARELLADQNIASKLMVPTDGVVAAATDDVHTRVVHFASERVADHEMILDIGPDTRAIFAQQCARATMIFWNGPLGLCEQPLFTEGSRSVARAISASPAFSFIGGGDTGAVVRALVPDARFSHISTGGGASLQYLSGAILPGLIALE